MLGKDGDLQPVLIAGGSFETLAQWNATRLNKSASVLEQDASSPSSAVSSALSTPIDSATPNDG